MTDAYLNVDALDIAPTPAPAWVAACMSPDEWETWVRLNPKLPGELQADRPCRDCPHAFATEMRRHGRCNGIPLGDGPGTSEEVPMTRPLDVAVQAPCGTCAHAPVCSIKRGLEELEVIQAVLPELDAAITVRLGATVTCTYYAKAKGLVRTAAAPASRWTPERRAAHSKVMREHAAAKAGATV